MNAKVYNLPDGKKLERDAAHGYLKVWPRPSDAELEAFYAQAYQNPCVPHDPESRADIILKHAKQPGRVLDIGCGNGEFLKCLKAQNWQVLGIEPGCEYAERTRAAGIEVVEAMLTENVAAELGTFDAVLLLHVLEHLAHPEKMLQMIAKLLKPGGLFLCEVPNDFNALQEVATHENGRPAWWVAYPDHLNYFSVSSLASFIESFGFDVLEKTTDFPMELFLLCGDDYIKNPALGKQMHQKRIAFEKEMRRSGKEELLRDWYRCSAALGIGREAIVCARKKG